MIYIDVSAAVHSRAGLGRYAEQLAYTLHRQDSSRYSFFFNQGRDGKLPDSLAQGRYRKVGWGYKPWRMAVWWAHLGRIGFNALVPDAQLFHSTEHLLFPLRDVPTVLTMHDLIFKLFPQYHKKLNYYFLNWAVPLFCQRATQIIAVSEATKRDLMTHYQLPSEKITVVHEAAGAHFRPMLPTEIAAIRQKYQLPDHYLIHLSTIEPRKNLTRLIEALQILRREFPSLQLLLVGSKGWLYDDFFAKIDQLGLKEAVRPMGWIPDHELPAIIAAADLAVQPSLYEGFGLPLLEEMACGQVVAASRASSFPEIGGEACAYFDPTNSEEMAQLIGRLLRDRDEYAHRQALGLAQSGRFSWEATAHATQAVYDKLLR